MSKDKEKKSPDYESVAQFLVDFKLAIEYGRCKFHHRPEIVQSLIDLNINPRQALEYICQLTPENYSKGPVPDDTDSRREVWIFGFDLEGTEVYIKLRLNFTKEIEIPRGMVWSFHKSKHPIRYPFRGSS